MVNRKAPYIVLESERVQVQSISYSDEGEIISVTYRGNEKDEHGNRKLAFLYSWDLDRGALDKMIRYPKQSRVLKGEEMAADPDYKKRLREFSQTINPKDEEALAQWVQKKQKGGKDL